MTIRSGIERLCTVIKGAGVLLTLVAAAFAIGGSQYGPWTLANTLMVVIIVLLPLGAAWLLVWIIEGFTSRS